MVLMPDQKVGVQRIFIWKSVEVGRIYRVETNTYNGKYGKLIWYFFGVVERMDKENFHDGRR